MIFLTRAVHFTRSSRYVMCSLLVLLCHPGLELCLLHLLVNFLHLLSNLWFVFFCAWEFDSLDFVTDCEMLLKYCHHRENCDYLPLPYCASSIMTLCRYAHIFPHVDIMFCTIILEFGKKGDLASALTVFEASKQNQDTPNLYIYRTAIDVCGLCGDYLKSRSIYEVYCTPCVS